MTNSEQDSAFQPLVRETLEQVESGNANYDRLRHIAAAIIGQLPNGLLNEQSPKIEGHEFARAVCLVQKRHFNTLRKRIVGTTTIEKVVCELFIIARVRSLALAYLSVQEGENFEGVDSYETPLPLLIRDVLASIGKRSYCRARLRLGPISLQLNWDPFQPVRRIYTRLLKSKRAQRPPTLSERAGNAIDLTSYRIRICLAPYLVKTWNTILHRRHKPTLTSILESQNFRLTLAYAIAVLFPDAVRTMTPEQWKELEKAIIDYFTQRLTALLTVIPQESLNNHGLIKLFKVAVGTIAGRIAADSIPQDQQHSPNFILDTVKLAYCWGVTYPLVDNILDSKEISTDSKRSFLKEMQRVFAREEPFPGTSPSELPPSMSEALSRLEEAITLASPHDFQRMRTFLSLLATSHGSDSTRKLLDLESLDREALLVVETESLADTMLKSAFIRLATMEMCGITVDSTTLARSFDRALFNQLGDDLWDAYEDFDDNRVTPFTLFLTQPGQIQPYSFYVNYGEFLAQNVSQRRQMALRLGVLESLKDAVMENSRRTSDPLNAGAHIRDLLVALGITLDNEELDNLAPHVDFDAVLFALEDALKDLGFRS